MGLTLAKRRSYGNGHPFGFADAARSLSVAYGQTRLTVGHATRSLLIPKQ
ncbi:MULTISPECIES: hypothetical protein [unclassified Moorena]|nr:MULTISPECIES: hypothetical protein [unclassified Moorena]NEO12619.1 hypothetical protein [Moorena sp. SIO3E8]NEP97669.1 hypothetical protein [Moorena sp. SIO3F7]